MPLTFPANFGPDTDYLRQAMREYNERRFRRSEQRLRRRVFPRAFCELEPCEQSLVIERAQELKQQSSSSGPR